MLVTLLQIRTWSKDLQNTVLSKFKDIKIHRSNLMLRQDNSFHLIFENVNGLSPDMGCYLTS